MTMVGAFGNSGLFVGVDVMPWLDNGFSYREIRVAEEFGRIQMVQPG